MFAARFASANTPALSSPSPSPWPTLRKTHEAKDTCVGSFWKSGVGLLLQGYTVPVCANEDDLKLLACLLDLPVGFHQHSGEASAGWALKDKSTWHVTRLLLYLQPLPLEDR